MTQDQWKCTPFNWVTDELVAAQSCQTRIPGRYIRDKMVLELQTADTGKTAYLKEYKFLSQVCRLRGRKQPLDKLSMPWL